MPKEKSEFSANELMLKPTER